MYKPTTESKAEIKLKWWPSLQDYNEAVQMPGATLNDPTLKSGLVYTNALGLPRPITGSFASVYRMSCGNTDYALRLFLKNIGDQEDRYSLISEFVQNDDLPYTVTFDFLKMGIRIHNEWLPALKMQWVEGIPFDDYIVENLANPKKLEHLLNEFVKMMQELQLAGIAHGDLQHGNIIMCGNELRLVDYDGMYVPKMKGYLANELGHRNYQHPKRTERHFGPYLDNFSAWVIYASLKAVLIDPSLFNQLSAGDDCLLFRQQDFLDPLHSSAFASFEKHENAELRSLGRFIRTQLALDPANVEYLTANIPELEASVLQPIADEVQSRRSGPRLVRTSTPEWLQESNTAALFEHKSNDLKTSASSFKNAGATHVLQSTQTHASAWVKPNLTVHLTEHEHNAQGRSQSGPAASSGTKSAQGVIFAAAPSQSQTVVVPAIPQELTVKSPRKVKFNKFSGKPNPNKYQWLMILNPLVWLLISTGYHIMTVDEDLAKNGVSVPATIIDTGRPRTNYYSVLIAYRLNGQDYTKQVSVGQDFNWMSTGLQMNVVVSPSNPNICEPFGLPAGTTQRQDLNLFLAYLFIVAFYQGFIWLRALRDWDLAKHGIATVATIDDLQINKAPQGVFVHTAVVSYVLANTNYKNQRIPVSPDEFLNMRRGDREVILCRKELPTNAVFYKFCRYHATQSNQITPQAVPTLPNSLPAHAPWYLSQQTTNVTSNLIKTTRQIFKI